jgi:hypothetical protein
MSDGYLDFSSGMGDDDVGKKNTRFVPKDNTAYRMTLAWYSVPVTKDGRVVDWNDDAAWNKDGTLNEKAVVRFTGANRIYVDKVGYVLFKSPAYAQFGNPRQAVATILIQWPTNSEGELDVAKFAAGRDYQVMPWIFSPDKYNTLKQQDRRFSLRNYDVCMTCPPNGAEYHKLTFTPESGNLFHKLLQSDKPEMKAVVEKIRRDVAAVAQGIKRDLARDMTVDEILSAMGQEPSSPSGSSGSHAAADVDNLLDEVL